MGNFRIEIEAVGGHGDRREIKGGEELDFASLPEGSLDRVGYEAVESLRARGASVVSAEVIHWPGQREQVRDEIVPEQRRHGTFGETNVEPTTGQFCVVHGTQGTSNFSIEGPFATEEEAKANAEADQAKTNVAAYVLPLGDPANC